METDELPRLALACGCQCDASKCNTGFELVTLQDTCEPDNKPPDCCGGNCVCQCQKPNGGKVQKNSRHGERK